MDVHYVITLLSLTNLFVYTSACCANCGGGGTGGGNTNIRPDDWNAPAMGDVPPMMLSASPGRSKRDETKISDLSAYWREVLDINKDGLLTIDEWLEKLDISENVLQEIYEFIRRHDVDGDEELTWNEFLQKGGY